MARLALTSLIEEVIAPHRDFGVELDSSPAGAKARNRSDAVIGVIYGLGNL